MTGLTIEDISHAYGKDEDIVRGVSLAVEPGTVTCLVGPSGCGKTTTLRLAAGLETLRRGRIDIDGRVVAAPGRHVPPEDRGIGMVFQDYALFPHLSVCDNVCFGLRKRKGDHRARAMEVLDAVGMAAFADTFPHTLSGGQQQRVALARALAPAPAVMLLDEPFSGLDTRLRDQVRDTALHVLKDSRAATLMVTHDPEEAMFMGDRLAVMDRGRVAQQGAPRDVWFRPRSAYVASFFGEVNRIVGTVRAGAVETPIGRIETPEAEDGAAVQVLVRPEAIHVCEPAADLVAPDGRATVVAARVLGRSSMIHLSVPSGEDEPLHLHSRMPAAYLPSEGTAVLVTLDRAQAFVFPASDGV